MSCADVASCRPRWPHDYLRVNTVFGVLHARGFRTAWIEKHPAYEILHGPGGTADGRNIDDFLAAGSMRP